MARLVEPNLFEFATSELSQDAFISWLISWAKPELRSVDESLHKTAMELLNALLDLGGIETRTQFSSVKIEQQDKHIDMLVLLDRDLVILIEDKVHTSQHSNQLDRYLTVVKEKYGDRVPIAIYLKTGDQCDYSGVEAAGYKPFLREDLLSVLEAGKRRGIANDIFLDFHAYLSGLEDLVLSYRSRSLKDWVDESWTGFFLELQRGLKDSHWEYTPNPSGGFMGFWWRRTGPAYLQLENGALCFKIEEEDKNEQKEKWLEWNGLFSTAGREKKMPLKRPARRRNGTWMTVALLDGDYRIADSSGVIDMERTMAHLKELEGFFDSVAGGAS